MYWCIVCEIDYGFKVFYVKKNVKKNIRKECKKKIFKKNVLSSYIR